MTNKFSLSKKGTKCTYIVEYTTYNLFKLTAEEIGVQNHIHPLYIYLVSPIASDQKQKKSFFSAHILRAKTRTQTSPMQKGIFP